MDKAAAKRDSFREQYLGDWKCNRGVFNRAQVSALLRAGLVNESTAHELILLEYERADDPSKIRRSGSELSQEQIFRYLKAADRLLSGEVYHEQR